MRLCTVVQQTGHSVQFSQFSPHFTMNKTGSNSGHFVKYWVKLTLQKYTNKMVISDQKRKINGMAPKIPKVYQVWQLSCYSTQLEKLNLGAFLKMATN